MRAALASDLVLLVAVLAIGFAIVWWCELRWRP